MPDERTVPTAAPHEDIVMDLLADHVPITLLVDLAEPPASEAVLQAEGLPEDAWWEHGDGAAD